MISGINRANALLNSNYISKQIYIFKVNMESFFRILN